MLAILAILCNENDIQLIYRLIDENWMHSLIPSLIPEYICYIINNRLYV